MSVTKGKIDKQLNIEENFFKTDKRKVKRMRDTKLKLDEEQLTNSNPELARKTADHINKDHPGVARVENGCCFVTGEYYKECIDYVKVNCRKKPEKG